MNKMNRVLFSCVLGLLVMLSDCQVEAGMSKSKKSMMKSSSKMSMKSSSKMSKSSMNVFAHPAPSPTPAATQPASPHYQWYYPSMMSKMGKSKSSMGMMGGMMGSYKGYAGAGAYSDSMKSSGMMMSGSYKGKGGSSSSMSGKGGSMSGKGKGKGNSIRMMGGKGNGKGKGKGAIYQTHSPTEVRVPTVSPSILNATGAPVVPPTPSTPPTVSPTEDAIPSREELCEANDEGEYGTQEGTVEVIDFAYALETVEGTTNAEVEQIIDDLEGEIAASVIRRLLPECNDDEQARRLQSNQPGTQRRLAQVLVGLSPKPDDVRLTDRQCDKDVGENRCDLVRASLTIWYIETDDRRRLQEELISEIEDAILGSMEDGEFDGTARDSNPDDPFASVVSVEWVPLEDLEDDGTRDITPPVNEDDSDDRLDLLWIIVIVAGGLTVCFLIAAGYFCTRYPSVDNEGEQRDMKEEDEDDGANDRAVVGRFSVSDSGRASL